MASDNHAQRRAGYMLLLFELCLNFLSWGPRPTQWASPRPR